MARRKKRKSYGSSTKDHAKKRRVEFTFAVRALKSTKKALNDENCREALRHLANANLAIGEVGAHEGSLKRKNQALSYGRLVSATNKAEVRFAKICLK